MKNLATILAVYMLFVFALPVAAEEPVKPSLAQKAKHVVKKGLMLPVYIIGGAGAGVIVWFHYGGEEGKLSKLFQGMKQ